MNLKLKNAKFKLTNKPAELTPMLFCSGDLQMWNYNFTNLKTAAGNISISVNRNQKIFVSILS